MVTNLNIFIQMNVAKVTSFQGGTLSYIPGDIQDFDKLNHPYAYVGYVHSDYVRMERQTNMMKAIFAKLKNVLYTQLLTDCLPYVETNLSKDEIISLGMDVLKVNLSNIG